MSGGSIAVRALLGTLDSVTAKERAHASAHGVMLLEGTHVLAAAGFSGLSLAAPLAIVERLDRSSSAQGVIVLHNDPHAGGADLNHLFMVTRAGTVRRYLVAALAFTDFGAMRRDVFRRQAETFHEGLSLSLLAVDWDGPERQMVLRVIETNVRHGASVCAVIGKAAQALLAAADESGPASVASKPFLLPGCAGHASAPVAEDGTLSVLARWSSGDPSAPGDMRLQLSRDPAQGQVARCSASSARSAAWLGVADALGMSWHDLKMPRIDVGNVAAGAPEAVGDGLPIAFACYRAAFEAACGLDIPDGMPRSIDVFTERLASR